MATNSKQNIENEFLDEDEDDDNEQQLKEINNENKIKNHSNSNSDSDFDENKEKSDEEWAEWIEEDREPTISIFSKENTNSAFEAIKIDKDKFGFDLLQILRDQKLKFYQKVKYINYLRTCVQEKKCFIDSKQFENHEQLIEYLKTNNLFNHLAEKSLWDHEDFLIPFIPNDPLIRYATSSGNNDTGDQNDMDIDDSDFNSDSDSDSEKNNDNDIKININNDLETNANRHSKLPQYLQLEAQEIEQRLAERRNELKRLHGIDLDSLRH
eukprot:TRINITY_DN2487_c0_g1_i1.p2 TRINITY_DN2487_c0_g1~~TRINITY_DN2487_c0_g1_i1.p2  ORF type:complete len:268 (-),score=137.21 TRINITY_DN2487_c0_g1_i1:1182-1985(-)